MTILTKGIHFTCECGIEAEANVARDFQHVRCCGDDIYSILCPNCGKPHEVKVEDIPEHIKKHIKKSIVGLGQYVD